MKTIIVKSRIGADGVLKLKIPTGEKEVNVDVVVILQTAERSVKKWPKGFFSETYGCLKNGKIHRLPQGDYPVRETLG